MERIVVKFGGSSVADAGQIKKVAAIVAADARRRIVVVSAPGKRCEADRKLTDLLYLCHDMVAMGASIDEPFTEIRSRFNEIATGLGVSKEVIGEIDAFKEQLQRGCERDFSASRGEYFCAKLVADYLGGEFVDPALYLTVAHGGRIVAESYAALGERLGDSQKLYVMAGFYGRDPSGKVTTFSRGGSDISGAIAARAAGAILYENWTDTSGILMADPRVVKNPRAIAEISFREIREMAYMGASVFHDEAILPVREAGIPIRIKNTNRPEDGGTLITPQLSAISLNETEIAGIAGRRGFTMVNLEKSLLSKERGFLHKLLGIFEELRIGCEQCPSSIDSISVLVEEERLGGLEEMLCEEIRCRLRPDSLMVEHDLALIAVVGEGMVRTIGIAAKIFTALQKCGVNVRVINQGASEMNIIVGVAGEDYQKAVRALYAAFVPEG
jgi:aspartate kinase